VRDSPIHLYLSARERHGDVVRFVANWRFEWYLVAHPDDIDRVMRAEHRRYQKGETIRVLKLLLGEGLLTSEGESWLRHRRLAQPAFHRRRVQALAPMMTGAAEEPLKRWAPLAEAGRPLDIQEEMMRLTFQVVGAALFSADMRGAADRVGPALTECLEHLNYRSLHPLALPERFPTRRNRRFLRARGELDRIAYALIEGRRRGGEEHDDLLSMLMEARDEETGEGMSDAQLRDEVLTILLAGHETTAVALSWTFYLLSGRPDVERRLHEELATVLGGRPPRAEDLPRLPYTRMVVEESMRLYPPAWALARQSREPVEVGGYSLPAGATFVLSPYVTHRHPLLWPDPERFDPERFTPERSEGRPTFAYFPFGGGPRHCIGNGFALMEAQLLLATIAQRHSLRLVPGHRVEPEPLVTLRPRGGLPMTLHPAG
jgi:cytochrome P450